MTTPSDGRPTPSVAIGGPTPSVAIGGPTPSVAGRPPDTRPASELEALVWSALEEIPDPELPLVSVVDLGLIGRVGASPERIHVELLPTFVGCHAVEVMRLAIADRLAGMAPTVEVEPVLDPPWTSERITAEGRRRLIEMGVAPPGDGPTLINLDGPVVCPYCGSSRTRLENAFGPTQCRTIRYCADCRNPFEAFKSV